MIYKQFKTVQLLAKQEIVDFTFFNCQFSPSKKFSATKIDVYTDF